MMDFGRKMKKKKTFVLKSNTVEINLDPQMSRGDDVLHVPTVVLRRKSITAITYICIQVHKLLYIPSACFHKITIFRRPFSKISVNWRKRFVCSRRVYVTSAKVTRLDLAYMQIFGEFY